MTAIPSLISAVGVQRHCLVPTDLNDSASRPKPRHWSLSDGYVSGRQARVRQLEPTLQPSNANHVSLAGHSPAAEVFGLDCTYEPEFVPW